MALRVNDVLVDASFALVERVCYTTLGTSVTLGTVEATPASMTAIYIGAQLIVDQDTSSEEVVTVSATTPSSFTATFTKSHAITAIVQGATFPSGQQDATPLFTQAEMLGSFASIQNEFLLRTRMVMAMTPYTYASGTRYYDQPPTCIRLERISISGVELLDSAQNDLDLEDNSWTQKQASVPTRWFQDEINVAKFGFRELPGVGGSANLWYSQRGAATLVLTDTLTVPDIFAYAIKYGVLAKCFEKDGEQRDPVRAKYCEKRFDFAVLLAHLFMEGVSVSGSRAARATPKFTGYAAG